MIREVADDVLVRVAPSVGRDLAPHREIRCVPEPHGNPRRAGARRQDRVAPSLMVRSRWPGKSTPLQIHWRTAPRPGTRRALRPFMTGMLDVLDILTSQHSDVDKLFDQLESGEGDRAELFAQLADKLAAHATVEEKIFYPAAMTTETSDQLHEAAEEHLEIKRMLADMLELDPRRDADTFNAKLSVLKENVTHHAHEEEEGKLFPKLRKLLDTDQRAGLGNDVLALFESLIDQSPRFQVPKETAEAAPLPSA